MKFNEEVFIVLLKQQTFYSVSKEDSSIIFGNPDAKVMITVFSNPHCSPCRKIHKHIRSLLDGRDDICIQFLFSSFNESLNDSNKFLCAAYLHESEEEAMNIFDEWFSDDTIEWKNVFDKYKFDLNNPAVQDEFERHAKWKNLNKLKETPTVLINGYKLPPQYKMEDLGYLNGISI